jgi:hypothetical protein
VIGIGLALLVVGVVLIFIAGPLGFVVAGVGLVLLVLFLLGFGRRAAQR